MSTLIESIRNCFETRVENDYPVFTTTYVLTDINKFLGVLEFLENRYVQHKSLIDKLDARIKTLEYNAVSEGTHEYTIRLTPVDKRTREL